MNEKLTICIAGKNSIAIDGLRYCLENHPEYNYVSCVNKTDTGENNFQRSYKTFCVQNNVPIVSLEELYPIKDLLFLSLEFDKLIKPELFSSSRLFNIHFSLLPAYKGMYTSAIPILNNEQFSGVTLHYIDKGIDTGDVIAQHKFEIGFESTVQDLYLKYIDYGTKLICGQMDSLIRNTQTGVAQPYGNASYYSRKSIDYGNVRIDMNKTAQEIHNQIRAFVFPYYQLPELNGIEISGSEIIHKKPEGKPGSVYDENDFYTIYNTIDFLIKVNKNRRAEFIESCASGDVEKFRYFVENGYNVHQRSREGWDALIIAGYNQHFELLKYLIEDMNWDVNTANNNGTTFAMYVMTSASERSIYECIQYILGLEDIDWKRKDYHGLNIFSYAKKYNNSTVINLISLKEL